MASRKSYLGDQSAAKKNNQSKIITFTLWLNLLFSVLKKSLPKKSPYISSWGCCAVNNQATIDYIFVGKYFDNFESMYSLFLKHIMKAT